MQARFLREKSVETSDLEIPEDLGLKMGTKNMILWEDSIKQTKATIESLEKALIINKAILEMAIAKVEEERLKVSSVD